jgi:hypothetical protein
LRNIQTIRYEVWITCGDFNEIRFRYEKYGANFYVRASARFSPFLDDFNLINFVLSNGKYIWSNER